MDQLKRTMLYMCTFYLPASLSASGFQGAGRQNPGSSQSCARPICLHWLTFSSHYGWPLSTHILSASLFLKLLHFSIGFLCVSSSLNPWQTKNGFFWNAKLIYQAQFLHKNFLGHSECGHRLYWGRKQNGNQKNYITMFTTSILRCIYIYIYILAKIFHLLSST